MHGVLVAPECICRLTADKCRTAALAILGDGLQPPLRNTVSFDGVSPTLLDAAREVAASHLGPVIAARLGAGASLFRVQCIVSEPGAEATPPNMGPRPGEASLSVDIALGPIQPKHGALLVWPGSHTPAFLAELSEHGAGALRTRPAHQFVRLAGDALLLANTMLRREEANTAHSAFPWAVSQRRAVRLVLTFGTPSGMPPELGLTSLQQAAGTLSGPAGAIRFAGVLSAAARGEMGPVVTWLDDCGQGGIDALGGSGPSTMLMMACAGGHAELVALLTRRRASVNLQDDHGSSALHEAASRGLSEIVLTLLRWGANVDLVTLGTDSNSGQHAKSPRPVLFVCVRVPRAAG